MLTRYWFTFGEKKDDFDLEILSAGCGITAYDLMDAKSMLESVVFPVCGVRDIVSVQEGVDVSNLDRNHVQLNMGVPSNRGVWFPLL